MFSGAERGVLPAPSVLEQLPSERAAHGARGDAAWSGVEVNASESWCESTSTEYIRHLVQRLQSSDI